MRSEQAIEVLKDLVISCQNHKRGTLAWELVERERFDMREEALNLALTVLENLSEEKI